LIDYVDDIYQVLIFVGGQPDIH